jgi:hypothetical protein
VPTDTPAVLPPSLPTAIPSNTEQPLAATPAPSATPTQTAAADASSVGAGLLPRTGDRLRDQGALGDLAGLVATAITSALVLTIMVLGTRLRKRSYTTWPGVIDEPEIGLGSYSEPYPLSSNARWKRFSGHPTGKRQPPKLP